MNRYKQKPLNIRGVSRALGGKGSTKGEVRALLVLLDGPCDCSCHHGHRDHPKGQCKCKLVRRFR